MHFYFHKILLFHVSISLFYSKPPPFSYYYSISLK
nr:MAG TPA: hypothetical protein [Caudoviricetes sp.]